MAERLRLKDFSPGEVWLVKDPRRVVLVTDKKEEVQFVDLGKKQRVRTDAIVLKATLPTFEIYTQQGDERVYLVSPKEVKTNRLLAKSVQEACSGEEGDDRVWEELWTERSCHTVTPDKNYGGAARVSEAWDQVQLFCFACRGRMGTRARHNYAARGQIDAVRVPPELVPKNLFSKETPNAKEGRRGAKAKRDEEGIQEGEQAVA